MVHSDHLTYIVGGGPSLSGFCPRRLPGKVIGVNQSIIDWPADVGVTVDAKFFRHRHAELRSFASGHPLFLGLADHWRDTLLPLPEAVYLPPPRSHTSGEAALRVAMRDGDKRIVLLGFDYGVIDGKHHCHDKYWWFEPQARSWHVWAQRFLDIAVDCARLGIEVINASPLSAITAFPKKTIDEAMAWHG